MEVWSHGANLYEVSSNYSLPDDAWCYELAGLCGTAGTGPYLAIAIPDATPDNGPFTPQPAQLATIRLASGQTPWLILRRFLDLVESSGDLIYDQQAPSEDAELPLSRNLWEHDGRQFEVNSFYFSEHDSWCYEMYEVDTQSADNAYIEVRVPDASPDDGPFTPQPADQVSCTAHGKLSFPWPVFRRYIDAINASGDIVDERAGTASEAQPRP
ncbi:hypothetical protein O7632_09870 [Solwaraspora sp. WMMD406]|uniref:hypothetical protein n=1 Tax=Solwaraspora sp. WMMD406 TaxID=3016095 RepID=UPI002417240B|nr:hypothetical protein [Solwaraspora sp. WMMD406]MDG4764408.1 hypothetical protein [Solwaraspora sp. WMMD406]